MVGKTITSLPLTFNSNVFGDKDQTPVIYLLRKNICRQNVLNEEIFLTKTLSYIVFPRSWHVSIEIYLTIRNFLQSLHNKLQMQQQLALTHKDAFPESKSD